jgi:hypothetical protein
MSQEPSSSTIDEQRQSDVFTRAGIKVTVAGRPLVVRPLVLRDWKQMGVRLTPILEQWMAGADSGFAAAISDWLPQEIAELCAMIAQGENGEPVTTDWMLDNVTGMAMLDLADAMDAANEIEDFLPRSRALRERWLKRIGRTPSTPSPVNTDGPTSSS